MQQGCAIVIIIAIVLYLIVTYFHVVLIILGVVLGLFLLIVLTFNYLIEPIADRRRIRDNAERIYGHGHGLPKAENADWYTQRAIAQDSARQLQWEKGGPKRNREDRAKARKDAKRVVNEECGPAIKQAASKGDRSVTIGLSDMVGRSGCHDTSVYNPELVERTTWLLRKRGYQVEPTGYLSLRIKW